MLSQVTVRPPRPEILCTRAGSLTYIHHKVLHNFADNMSCLVEDIDRVIYVISPYRLTIMSIRVVLTNGVDYIFTYNNRDAEGRPEDIAYTTKLRPQEEETAQAIAEANDPDFGSMFVIMLPKYRVHLSELIELPYSVAKRIGARSSFELKGDLTVSLPGKKVSYTKHHKVLEKIDRRRRKGNQEIYKEWDETITYYPITVVDYAHPDEPIIATDDDQ